LAQSIIYFSANYAIGLKSLSIHEALPQLQNYCIIDVRSPGEFAIGHIPGAFNVPLFEDQERAEIGTLYKSQGQFPAIDRGLEIVGPKMLSIVKAVRSLVGNSKLLIHCWRGGMRSGSVGWLLETAGLEVHILEGGYKAYRTLIFDFWKQSRKIMILSGYTGSGKTELLNALHDFGEQVVDLEFLAHHKGSAFGGIGQPNQPTTEQFQNNLHWAMKDMDPAKVIWMEDESVNMGQAFIPDELFFQMRSATLIVAHLSKEARIDRLVSEYGSFSNESLLAAIEKISKRLGGLRFQEAKEDLAAGDLVKVVANVLLYYDRAYLGNIEKRRALILFEKEYDYFDANIFLADLLQHNLISN